MITPAAAEKLILENTAPLLREDCPLLSAHGRILRGDLRADRDLPPFDRVTMDGYALRSAAVAAGVTTFRIQATQAAGMRPFKLNDSADSCIEVMTGAVLPDGADCVIPLEDTQRDGTTLTLDPSARPIAGSSIHRRGSDHAAGSLIVPAGVKLTGREIAVAAAIGAASVVVSALPKIVVLATGDELVDVEAAVAPHQIRRSNDYALRAALIAAGYPRVDRVHVRDVKPEVEQTLGQALAEYDAVLITGGVSKGKFDFLPTALAAQGVKKIFHGVAQRPGKPLWFGVSPRRTPVFALPGNPVSTYTCLHRYVLPALAHASGAAPAPIRTAALATPVAFKPPLAYFLPVKLSSGPHAELLATPHPTNTSGDFGALIDTDGFIELPATATDFPPGTVARFWSWV